SVPLWDDRDATFPLTKTFDITAENLPLLQEGFRLDGPGATITMVTFETKTHTGIVSPFVEQNRQVYVYNLQGVRIRTAASESEAIANLPAGLYIVNGKKVKL
ncbi:MAG: T9SS type A sorting domain-containing protein, partial [Muribaculaceae bacterium]|nr:T9SS type A sorting domain-containing protein [Muribaculaceae bacterium]